MDVIEFTERHFGVEFTEYQKEYIRKLDEKGRDNMSETKTHLIADESIGGVQREFIEVERMANVGDYVWLINVGFSQVVGESRLKYVIEQSRLGNIKTLSPTDIVHIEGTRYQLAERKARVGEDVMIVNAKGSYDMYTNGDVIEAEKLGDYGIYNGNVAFNDIGSGGYNSEGFVDDKEYRVLVPVKPTLDELVSQITPENRHEEVFAEPTPDIAGLIANLAQRVTSLERITGELVRAKSSLESQLRDTQNNVQTFAEQTESNTKDIAFLDERTFEKPGKPTKSAEEILREISKILERDDKR